MSNDNLKTLSDNELAQLAAKAQAEIAARKRRKDDAIARIKQLAGSVGVSVAIKGARGRPPAVDGAEKSPRPAQAK